MGTVKSRVLKPKVTVDSVRRKWEEKYAQLARNIFFIDIDEMELNDAAEAFISRFENWMKKVGMYAMLSDEGIGDEKLEKMVDDTIEVYGGGEDYIKSYKPLHKEDLTEIFKMAM